MDSPAFESARERQPSSSSNSGASESSTSSKLTNRFREHSSPEEEPSTGEQEFPGGQEVPNNSVVLDPAVRDSTAGQEHIATDSDEDVEEDPVRPSPVKRPAKKTLQMGARPAVKKGLAGKTGGKKVTTGRVKKAHRFKAGSKLLH